MIRRGSRTNLGREKRPASYIRQRNGMNFRRNINRHVMIGLNPARSITGSIINYEATVWRIIRGGDQNDRLLGRLKL